MRYLLAAVLLCSLPAFAKKKPVYNYQDGVLVNFRTVANGTHCSGSGSVNGTVNANSNSYDQGQSYSTTGTVHGSTNTESDCRVTQQALYTISVDGHIYVLRPYLNPAAAVLTASPLIAAFRKNSDLYSELPGSRIQVRSEDGSFYVRAGKRESRYALVEAK